MKKNQILANRIREVLLDGKWIANTNFKDQIINISREQAIQKIDDLNSIAMLTYHVNYYLSGLINVFDGGKLNISDKYSFDIPEINSRKDWDDLVIDFLSNSEKFANQVEQMDEGLLDEIFEDEKYGNYQRNIEGFIEHSYYHLGQISLIRKLISVSK